MPPRFLAVLVAALAAVLVLVWPAAPRPPATSRLVRAPAAAAAPEAVAPSIPAPPATVVGHPTDRVNAPSPASQGLPFARGGIVGGPSAEEPSPLSPAAALRADTRGRLPTSGQARVDALGNREVRLDNGVTATTTTDALGGSTTRFSNGVTASSRTDALGGTTTHFSNGVTASSRKDALGNVETVYSDGTRATTRVDPFGNQVTTYSDGRTETIRPDPFAPRAKEPKK